MSIIWIDPRTDGILGLCIEVECAFIYVKNSSTKLDTAYCDFHCCLETSVEGYIKVMSNQMSGLCWILQIGSLSILSTL